MKGIFALFSQPAPPPGGSEGLPYWIFWLLLCIILLLVSFIFLRDKELRLRLNMFFFGAKKKLLKIQLQARLRRENRKKQETLKDLGRRVWEEDISIPQGEKLCQELTRLQKEKISLENQTKTIQLRIQSLESESERFLKKHRDRVNEQEAIKKPFEEKAAQIREEERQLEMKIIQEQKELEGIVRGLNAARAKVLPVKTNPSPEAHNTLRRNLQEKISELARERDRMDQDIKNLVEKRLNLERERRELQRKSSACNEAIAALEEEEKRKTREFQKEIREWKKNRGRILEKIRHIDQKKEPLFEHLGRRADEARLQAEELTVFYSQIDRFNERIGELELQIKNL
ncbi:MAG: hypothetical protein ACE5LV_08615 [Candidatus Aminicenantales bacterium]